MPTIYQGYRDRDGRFTVHLVLTGCPPLPLLEHYLPIGPYAWGDHSPASLELASAILLHAASKDISCQLAPLFLEEVVSRFPLNSWHLSDYEVRAWITRHTELLATNNASATPHGVPIYKL